MDETISNMIETYAGPLRVATERNEKLELDLAAALDEVARLRVAAREHPAALEVAERRGERKGIARCRQVLGWKSGALRKDEANAALCRALDSAVVALGELSV